jgi:hypothetical protein
MDTSKLSKKSTLRLRSVTTLRLRSVTTLRLRSVTTLRLRSVTTLRLRSVRRSSVHRILHSTLYTLHSTFYILHSTFYFYTPLPPEKSGQALSRGEKSSFSCHLFPISCLPSPASFFVHFDLSGTWRNQFFCAEWFWTFTALE